MATPTIGTIPALPQYQPGALTIVGTEILEIASSANATTAASYYMNLTDIVGKAPGVMTSAVPASGDIVAFFQISTNLPRACAIGSLGIPTGNMPTGGGAGYILQKNSSTNYDASFLTLSGLVSASTGLFVTGSTSIAVGVATNAIGNSQIRQGQPLSVIGVAGNATANVADIVASSGAQYLQTNSGGTGVVWSGSIATGAMPGPYQTGSFSINGILFGNSTNVLNTVPAGSTGLVLITNGATTAPSFGVANLSGGGLGTNFLTKFGMVYGLGTTVPGITAAGNTGIALVANGPANAPTFTTVQMAGGGFGTTTLTNFGIVYGQATSTPGITPAGGTGMLFGSTGTANQPNFTTIPQLGGVGQTASLNFAGQTSGIVSIYVQQTAGTYNFNIATTAGLAGQALISGGGAASPQTWTGLATGVGWGLTGATATSFSPSISTTLPPYGFDSPINVSMTASVLTSVLTVTLLAANGSTPAATNPILVPFKNTSTALGSPLWVSLSTSVSISTIIGASFGAASGSTPFRVWQALFYQNATNALPALINCSNTSQIFPLAENTLATTVGMTATATLAGTFYSPTGTTALNSPYRIIGYVEYANGVTTAGTYSTAPTTLQLFGPGIKKPGDVVQTVVPNLTAIATTNFSSTLTTTNVSATISLTSPVNLVKYAMSVSTQGATTGVGYLMGQLYRVTTPIGSLGKSPAFDATGSQLVLIGMDAPATTAAVYYVAKAVSTGTSTNFSIPAASNDGAGFILDELMG